MAWQRARASNGKNSWVAELYGKEPEFITRAISRVTYELMIEQQRQEEKAMAEAGGGYVDSDLELRLDPDSGYRYIRDGSIRVRY